MDSFDPKDLPESLRNSTIPRLPPPSDALTRALSASLPPSAPAPEKPPFEKLQECVEFGTKLLKSGQPEKHQILQWTRKAATALNAIFGFKAPITSDLNTIARVGIPKISHEEFEINLANVASLLNSLAAMHTRPLGAAISSISAAPTTKNIFLIHGHDELNTRRLAHLLQNDFGLNPVVMWMKPGLSRPLTQKFEEEAQSCSFSFALLTPDDQVINSDQEYNQARPNVIYEVGWFVGRLGRQRVTLLLKEGTTIHSDLHGVSQIRFFENVQDKSLEIQKELKAAGLVK